MPALVSSVKTASREERLHISDKIPLLSGQSVPIRLIVPTHDASSGSDRIVYELSADVLPRHAGGLTRCVVIRSRLLVVNNSRLWLEVRQAGHATEGSPVSRAEYLAESLRRGERVSILLPPRKCLPIHFLASQPEQLVVRPVSASLLSSSGIPHEDRPRESDTNAIQSLQWRWSGAFGFDVHEAHYGLRIVSADPLLSATGLRQAVILPVHSSASPDQLSCISIDDPASVPPYRCVDQCSFPLALCCTLCSRFLNEPQSLGRICSYFTFASTTGSKTLQRASK